jgi:exopolysaccharide biosynthesis polyprenyl glycosylphosphotransferase
MSTFNAQRFVTLTLSRFVPPLAAMLVILLAHEELTLGLLTFAAIVFLDIFLRTRDFPLHLVPLAHYSLSVVMPTAGVALAFALSHLGGSALSVETALLTAAVADVVSLAILVLGNRFIKDRPIRTVVIGNGGFAERLGAELHESQIDFYRLIGYVDADEDEPTPDPGAASDLPCLGSMSDIRSVVQENRIDLLVVSPTTPRLPVFEQTAKACLDLEVRMIEATALYERVLGHVPIGAINSAWFQYIMHPSFSPSSPMSKRVLDIVVSGAMLVVAGPLMIVCALAVKLGDRGPVLYRQRRLGEEGHEFHMIKFRCLRPDADRLLDEGKSEEEVVTPVGRILRKGHLNELPQLLQVLRGEMSLVGPRPEPPELVQTLSWTVPHYDRRALVKPGLTGWAQVRCGYAASRIGSAWKTCHDLYYIKHRSVGLDIVILLQTFHALIERDDAQQVPSEDFILGDPDELIAR